MSRPLCFALMPFGQKPDSVNRVIDFDAVYAELIKPAIQSAGLEPIRADEERGGGVIHKAMFERLILCEFAVADLTTANPNVFYELGVRHAVRPYSTVLIFAEGTRLPFDLGPVRAMPYPVGADGRPTDPAATREAIVLQLRAAEDASRQAKLDSPVFQLVEGYPAAIAHEKTDVFRDAVIYSETMKQRLAEARRLEPPERALAALQGIEAELRDIAQVESGVVIDLLLSYRAVSHRDALLAMIALVGKMSRPLAESTLVQEQLGFALNRVGEGERAERVLRDVLDRHGPSSETYGLLGRVYKDRWEAALARGDRFLARGLLDASIDMYRRGFEADWRDAYPGVNAVTLMELKEPPDPRRERLLPVVRYAVERKIALGKPDYWDHATMLEIAVLMRDQTQAESSLAAALACVRERWEPETTERNLRLIREARERRGEASPWGKVIEAELGKKANSQGSGLQS